MRNLSNIADTVLISGANGFVGRSLHEYLTSRSVAVIATARNSHGGGIVAIGDIGPNTDWAQPLVGCEVVVHLAGRVHMSRKDAPDSLDAYRTVNVLGTLRLARQAALSGVRRFVFLSSIKVNGEKTDCGQSFSADDQTAPCDEYAISKAEAELGLRTIAAQTGMEVVIIRPPLVYGPGVKANFYMMMHWVANRFPLPLGGVDRNRRSLVALDNLVDLIVTCISHPAAANQIFLVSDGEDLSTADLLRRLGRALGKPVILWTLPRGILQACAVLVGRPEMARRLSQSLQVDITKTKQLLNWVPPMSVDEGLRVAAQGYWREKML